jgi:hypothetical protein
MNLDGFVRHGQPTKSPAGRVVRDVHKQTIACIYSREAEGDPRCTSRTPR